MMGKRFHLLRTGLRPECEACGISRNEGKREEELGGGLSEWSEGEG